MTLTAKRNIAVAEKPKAVRTLLQCRVDAAIVRCPDRYIDGRGGDMWSFIQSRLGEEAA